MALEENSMPRARLAATLAAALALPLAAAPALAKLKVGAASRSVLPLVGGTLDYLAAGFPDRSDALDPGIVVPAWDDGRIAVGNGEGESYWVHDDLRATAMALDAGGKILVLVASDLYMVFRVDADGIRSKAAALLGSKLAKRTRIVVTASHNHHGPDTAFDVNHDWYEHMTDQVAAAVAEAVANRRPAELRVAAGEHFFGQKDGTDPRIYDPRLNVLQAVDREGQVIATAVQWNNHPEGTLGWGPPVEEIADDCTALGLVGEDCDAEGRTFTADYPGILRQDLQARYGGEVLYLNGALGVLVGPGGAQVWEVTKAHPLGNQLVAPAGATAPGGGTDYGQRNFRRTVLVGEQLAAAAERLLDAAERVKKAKVSYKVEPFYTRLSNFGFRVLLVVDEDTGRTALGHTPAVLHTCPALGPKTDKTCVEDGFAKLEESALGVSYRAGDHVKSAVEYVRIGPIGMMLLPGEIPGELTAGLPSAFRTHPEQWYEEPPGTHTFGGDYHIPGYVSRHMKDRFQWTVGLGSDELGYFVPLSNYRILCVADEFIGDGACAQLQAEGHIEYPDSVSGAKCKALTEDPSQLEAIPPPARLFVAQSCRLGQALGEANGHYEETNSAGWDLAQDMLDAVAAITRRSDPTEVNEGFMGWWQGLLPPGDLP
jgi:hypothetical protein